MGAALSALSFSALGFSALTSPALAQQLAQQLPEVQVTAERAGAENTTTIGSERLQQGGARLDETLRGIPGVFTRQNAQQPGLAVNIRGFEGAGRVNMSIDGVRQNFRFTGHEAGGFTYVDPNLLSSIDISRGAVTGVGGGALAGSVNLRTLTADDVLLPGHSIGALSRLSWGSNGVAFQEMLAGAARFDGVSLVGAISHRDSDNYHDGNGDSVAGTGQTLYSGLVKAGFEREGHSLNLGAVVYDNDFFANSYGQTVNNRTLTANYRYNPGNPLLDLKVNGYYNDLTMKYTSGSASGLGRVIEDEGLGFDISNLSRFSLGPVAVRSNNGVEYFHDDVSAKNGGVNPGDGTSALLGVFTDTTFSYGLFDLTPGLRYNHYWLEGSGVLSRNYGAYDVDISEGSLDPKITLAVNVTDWLQPYVTWSRSLRAPTLQETMLGGDHPGNVSSSYIPNPNLKPEQQQGWEFGANLRRGGLVTERDMLTARAAYYTMDVEDYIVASWVGSGRSGVFQMQNVAGTSKVQGFEAEVNYDARVVFASLGYSHTDSDLPSQVPGLGASQYLPDNTVSATLGGRFLEERITIGARYDYVSEGKVAALNSSFTGASAAQGGKAYNLVGLFASAKVTENIELNARVTNLMNEQFTPFLSTNGNGQGRTVYLGTQIRF